MKPGILTDLTRCVRCKACVYACKEINGLPKDDPDYLTAKTWTTVQARQGVNVRRHCMHCLEPACVSVCPVGALRKTQEGPVTYEEKRCMGCRYCMVACPFGVPKYEWDKALPRVQKCIFCHEKRLQAGKQPACTEVCPAQASIFGDRDGLIRDARQRIQSNPGRYVDRIYGLEEAGGTSVLYLSGVPFEQLGFPSGVRREPYPKLTWEILSKIPDLGMVGGACLLGVWWIINRRMENDRMNVLVKAKARSSHAGDACSSETGAPRKEGQQ